jgi:hypothetical protein
LPPSFSPAIDMRSSASLSCGAITEVPSAESVYSTFCDLSFSVIVAAAEGSRSV